MYEESCWMAELETFANRIERDGKKGFKTSKQQVIECIGYIGKREGSAQVISKRKKEKRHTTYLQGDKDMKGHAWHDNVATCNGMWFISQSVSCYVHTRFKTGVNRIRFSCPGTDASP